MSTRLLRVGLGEVRIFAFHGVYPEEQVVGTDFRVSVSALVPFAGSGADNLADTFDYEQIHAIVVACMSIPRKLIETVAEAILTQVLSCCPVAQEVSVKIRKINPPLPGETGSAFVELLHHV